MLTLQDVLAALGVVLNGIPQMIYAMSFGFLAGPTAIAFIIAAVGMVAYGTVMPISMQAETIALAGTMGRSVRERLSIVLFSGILMAILGAFGLLRHIIDFAGDSVIFGMKVGVGIILARVAFEMVKANRLVGIISTAVALVVWALSQNLVYVIVSSVVASSVAAYIKNKGPIDGIESEKFKFSLHKPMLNFNIVRATLALVCLTIGANIAFGGITAGMSGAEANIDGLTVYSGLASVGSAMFGGAPVEAIISATGAAPNPMWAGVLMMGLFALILITGLLPKIARFVPMQSIAGFLFVLGALVTVPINAWLAFGGATPPEAMAAGVTIVVTALADPFIGLVAGIILRIAAQFFGLSF